MNEEKLLQVVLAPHVSEKATSCEADRQYVLHVRKDATKLAVKKAVEHIFKVNVTAVRICNVKAKNKTFGRIQGRRPGWKKAYVTLQEGQVINYGNAG